MLIDNQLSLQVQRLEYLNNHPTMKALIAEVQRHPSVLLDFQSPLISRVILNVASLPFSANFSSRLDFACLFNLQNAELSPDEVSRLFKLCAIVRCCAKCFSRDKSLSPCHGCGIVIYCCHACQSEHYTEHHKYCAMLNALRLSGHTPSIVTA